MACKPFILDEWLRKMRWGWRLLQV
jgi:hypothetical protein